MTFEERQAAIERYAERLRRFGPAVQALGWRDREQQDLRFRVLTGDVSELAGKSVLDVGCGFGDLYDYLLSRGATVGYAGCDISPDVLAVARTRHPGLAFDQRDIVSNPYEDGAFDYVMISGIFNHRLADNRGFVQNTLRAAFRACRCAVAANMMTDQVDYRDDYLHYFNPEDILAFCRTLSRHVALRHDYRLFEFTVFVRHQPTCE